MHKLKAQDNVLAAFLSQQNLSERELNFLKPCGSDGMGVYLNRVHLTDITNIQSIRVQSVSKRLRQFKDLTLFQGLMYVCFVFAMPWLWPYVESYLTDEFQTYLWILIAIYMCVDVLVWYVKQRQHPKVHYQLTLHTRFGEQYVFAQAENQETLLQLEAWLQSRKSSFATATN